MKNPYDLNLDLNSYNLIKQKRKRNFSKRKINISKDSYKKLKSLYNYKLFKIEFILESIITKRGDELFYGSTLFSDKNYWAREVQTPVGRIDALNKREKRVVELKFISGWKSALGQVLSYHFFYSDYIPEIWLLDNMKVNTATKNLITTICDINGVKVEFIDI